MLDDSVRKSYELNPSQFVLVNPAWHNCIGSLLSKTYTELDLTCSRTNVKAELYKLLVYEQGAFFKSHQDSEKTPGMFGTLVVSLPSEHKGGEVILTHNKAEHIFGSSKCPDRLIGTTSFGLGIRMYTMRSGLSQALQSRTYLQSRARHQVCATNGIGRYERSTSASSIPIIGKGS